MQSKYLTYLKGIKEAMILIVLIASRAWIRWRAAKISVLKLMSLFMEVLGKMRQSFKSNLSPEAEAHICHPSYSGGRNQEDCGWG
jgi:hypothetical protein